MLRERLSPEHLAVCSSRLQECCCAYGTPVRLGNRRRPSKVRFQSSLPEVSCGQP